MTDSTRRRAPRGLIVAAGAVLLVVLALVGSSYLNRPKVQRAGSVELGRLPGTIDRTDLNLLLITLDTTRADRIGVYGGPRAAETPAFDRLAAEGVLFEQAMTSAPLTLPAHATMFTGLFPPGHGVRDNGGFFLGPDANTLAERLQAAGFRTGAFVAAFVLDSKWGLDQGFDHYVDDFDTTSTRLRATDGAAARPRGRSLGDVQRRADEVVDHALPWLDEVHDDRFFAWLHFYDAHAPYSPPEPFATNYAGRLYDGEVAFADAQIARVIEFLDRRGLLDRTIVAVLADHGESLGEHDEGTHGFFIYEQATHTPFVIRAPFARTRGRRVADPVRTADLMPTMLDLLGLPPVTHAISGVSLAPLMTGDQRELNLDGYAEAMYPLHHYGWSSLRALRSGRFKLIDAPRPELFDLETDPGETQNLYQSRLALGTRMQSVLREIETRLTTGAPVSSAGADVDPEVRERLAALGYVGSFVATPSESNTGRADPKDKIELFNLMSEARDHAKTNSDTSFTAAVALLERVIKADPNVIDAWFNLGNEHFKAARFEDAIRYFKRALELKPDYDLALINMANSYRALGQDEAALAGYEHYLRVDPKNAWVHYQMGEVFLDRGDLAAAHTRFEQALSLEPKLAAARNALGAVAFMRGDAVTAERHIRAALDVKPDVRLAHFNLGLIAEAAGDSTKAAAAYANELKLHDNAYRAAFNLARIHQREGRPGEALAFFERAIAINARFAEGHFYLAKTLLDLKRPDEALAAAQKGLDIDKRSTEAALAYFVIADVYAQRGRVADAERAFFQGRALEAQRRPERP